MLTGPDYGRDDACLMIDFPNPITSGVTNIQIVLRIKSDPQRQIEPGLSTHTFIPAITSFPDSGEVVDRPVLEVHPSDAVRSRFREIEPLLFPIKCPVMRKRDSRFHCALAVARTPSFPVTGKGFNIAGGQSNFGFHMYDAF